MQYYKNESKFASYILFIDEKYLEPKWSLNFFLGSTFNLNEETGFVTTKPGKSPDYESTSLYNFVVTAQDKGSPPLSVNNKFAFD